MKQCTKCKKIKNDNCFNKKNSGLSSHCKDCISDYRKTDGYKELRKKYNHSKKGIAARKKYRQKLEKTEAYKVKKRIQKKKYKVHNKRKAAAHKAVARALKNGKLIKEPCCLCDNPETFGHHENYENWLDVIWLCCECHNNLHNGLLIAA